MITLNVISGPEKGRKHRLPDDRPLLIGRRHGDVPLDDRAVSKEHARIEAGPLAGWIIRDLGSANGTWLNGQRIDGSADLSAGDKVQIGRSVLVFKQAPGTPGTPGSVPAASSVPGSGTGLHDHASDDTHANSETLHHALQLQQAHGQALEEIRNQIESLAEQLSRSNHAATPVTDDWAASARSAIAAEIGSAVAELGRRLDAIERRVQQAAETAKTEATKAAAPTTPTVVDPQLTAAVADLRQSVQALPAQLDARPALQQVLVAVERLSPADHAADFAALREAVAAAADQGQQRALLEQVLAAVMNLKLPEPPEMPALPEVPDHRGELASLRETIAALPAQLPQPIDHAPQLAAIQAALSDTTRDAALEQKLAEIIEAVRVAGDQHAVLEAIRVIPASLPGAPQPIDYGPQLQQVLDAVASMKDPALAARFDELLARPAAEQGLSEALQSLRTTIESAPKPIDPTPALAQQLAELREALTARIDAVTAASAADQPLLAQILETITAPQPPQTDPALMAHLEVMQEKIAGLPAVDIAPLEAQITQLASHLDTLKPQPDARLDDLLKAVEAVRTTIAAQQPPPPPPVPTISLEPLEQKLEAIEAALAQRDGDRELVALLAAAQEQAATASRTDGLLETMLAELGEKLDAMRPDSTHHALTQVLTELRNRPEPDVSVRTALLELRTSIEQRMAAGGVIDDAAAKQAALAAAQASIRPVIDMLHEIATEMSHWPKRQERVLGELYAAMRDLQLQQEQHEDRLLRLADHIGAADRPRRTSGSAGPAMATMSRMEREELTGFDDEMPQAVAIERREPSMMLTVAVVFFIVVMTFMAIAGTTQWL